MALCSASRLEVLCIAHRITAHPFSPPRLSMDDLVFFENTLKASQWVIAAPAIVLQRPRIGVPLHTRVGLGLAQNNPTDTQSPTFTIYALTKTASPIPC